MIVLTRHKYSKITTTTPSYLNISAEKIGNIGNARICGRHWVQNTLENHIFEMYPAIKGNLSKVEFVIGFYFNFYYLIVRDNL